MNDHNSELRPDYRSWLLDRAPLDDRPDTLPRAHAEFCAGVKVPLDDEHVPAVATLLNDWLPVRCGETGARQARDDIWEFARHLTSGILATLPDSVHKPEPAFPMIRSEAARRQMQSYYNRLRPALEGHLREVIGTPVTRHSWRLWLLPSVLEHYDHAMRELGSDESHAGWCLGYGTGVYINCLEGEGLSALFGTLQHQ